MYNRRNVYHEGEAEFLVDAARRSGADTLTHGGKAAYEQHKLVRAQKGWPSRSRGSITNKLYQVESGRHKLGEVKHHARFKTNGVDIDSAYARYRARIQHATARFEEEQVEAKNDLISSLK